MLKLKTLITNFVESLLQSNTQEIKVASRKETFPRMVYAKYQSGNGTDSIELYFENKYYWVESYKGKANMKKHFVTKEAALTHYKFKVDDYEAKQTKEIK